MTRNYSNTALDTTLTAGIAAGDLSCVVASAAGWPAASFAAVIDPGLAAEEVVQVTNKTGTTFTITRGFDGTTAAAHALGATVRHSAIAGDFTDLQAADTAEVSARAGADTTLQTNITSEASTRATADSTHAALTTSAHGGVVASTDPRMTDSRTPLAHATSHQNGGSDAIKLDDFATPDDNTDLDATTGRHGLLLKLGGGATNFLRADGTWNAPAGGGGVSDGDKVDITVSGSGTIWTIDPDAVTYAKMQDVSATDRVLGRSTAGAGNVEEIAFTAAMRALADDADSAAMRATLAAAPLSATYITQTANGELSAEQALGALASGYLKNTTTTGVLSVQATPIPVADGGTGVAALSQALTDAATIAWDVSLGALGTVTLGGNRTMGAPSNLVAGRSYALKVTQDGTGSRTLAYNAVFKWAGGVAPTLSTAIGAIDILTFLSDGTNMYGAIQKAYA